MLQKFTDHKNPETEKEKKQEEESFLKRIGALKYLGQGSFEAEGMRLSPPRECSTQNRVFIFLRLSLCLYLSLFFFYIIPGKKPWWSGGASSQIPEDKKKYALR